MVEIKTQHDIKYKIRESGYRLGYIATVLGISYQGLKQKLDGNREFKAGEMAKLSRLLNLTPQDTVDIFFKL